MHNSPEEEVSRRHHVEMAPDRVHVDVHAGFWGMFTFLALVA